MADELKPCPFCGNHDIVVVPNDLASCGRQMSHPGVDANYAHCDSCGMDGPVEDDDLKAREAWNRRAPVAEECAGAALTDEQLADPEYMRAYVGELQDTIGELLAARAAQHAVSEASTKPLCSTAATQTEPAGDGELPPLPAPDVHTGDEAFGDNVSSYSPAALQQHARTAIASRDAIIADLRAQFAKQGQESARLHAALLQVRQALQFANDSPDGGISDTLWMIEGPETVFDFIDATLAVPDGDRDPIEQLVDTLDLGEKDAAPEAGSEQQEGA